MDNDQQLTVVEQRQIGFYGDDLVAVRTSDGNVYAALKQMCNALGIDAQGQRRRIQRHAVLIDGLQGVDIMATPSLDGRGGGVQTAYALRVDLVPLWLSGIQASRVAEDVRDKLIRFQKEVGRVLWEAFQTGELSIDDDFNDLLLQDTQSVQAYKMIMAMAKMARQQIVLENRIDQQDATLAIHDSMLGDFSQRLESIEADLGRDDRLISNAQAVEIAQGVKQIAMFLSKNSGSNAYGGVYGELHRRFEIPSYRQLPASKFDEATHFLTSWYAELTGTDLPF